jgi:hypothetical protein
VFARGHLADKQDQRHLVLLRGVHRDRRVACAGATAHADNTGPPGEPCIGDRHEARTRFVPTGDGVDVGPAVERIEQAEIALAGNAEQPVDAVGDEAADDQLTTGAHLFKLLWRVRLFVPPHHRRRPSPSRCGPSVTAVPMWSRGSRSHIRAAANSYLRLTLAPGLVKSLR